MTRRGVVTAAEILATIPAVLLEYPLWTPGCEPRPVTIPRRGGKPVPDCGTANARKRHRRRGEDCVVCGVTLPGGAS